MSKPVDVTCADVLDRFEAWIDGELEPADAAKLDSHVAGCAACRDEHRFALEIRSQLQAMPVFDPPARVVNAVHDAATPTMGERLNEFLNAVMRRPAPAVAAVAVIAVLVLAVVPLLRTPTTPRYSAEEVERATEETKLALAYVGGIARHAERQARQKVMSEAAVSGTLREISRSIEWTGAAVSPAPSTTKRPKRIDEGSS